jgi:hypothetical protein
MVLAEVVAGESAAGGRPLVYHQGRFGTLA